MKVLPFALLPLGVVCFLLPAFFETEGAPLISMGPMLGILFVGVGAAILVANAVCSKKR